MTQSHHNLLDQLLPLVPFDGWSDHALREAAAKAGVKPLQLRRLCPKGALSCIDAFFDREDESLKIVAPSLDGKRVPEKIESLILHRLERFAKHREAVRRAVAQLALPWNAVLGATILYRTVDVIWRLAGDNATDFNFYTKRATLAGVYSSTLLYWLNDESDDMTDTQAFVKRRLADVAAFGKKKKIFKERFNSMIY